MYPIHWIDSTGWNIHQYFPPKPKQVVIITNTLTNEYKYFEDMSVFVYSEPPEVIPGIDNYVLQNWNKYDYILTWDENILKNCPNARKMLYIDPWVKDCLIFDSKEFKVSFLRGTKTWAPGHQLRHEVYKNYDKISAPKQFLSSIPFDRLVRQDALFSYSQYNIAIENSRHNNYFTEKILDCFLTKTIPIYWGCPNIWEFFNELGIIAFDNQNELYSILNSLDEKYYEDHLKYVERNYVLAKEMCKDLGIGGYKTLDRKIDELLSEKYGYSWFSE